MRFLHDVLSARKAFFVEVVQGGTVLSLSKGPCVIAKQLVVSQGLFKWKKYDSRKG